MNNSKPRMTTEEKRYDRKRRLWFNTIYPVLKQEDLTKDKMGEIANKISELIIHLVENGKQSETSN